MHESHTFDEPKSKLESMLEHLKEYVSTSFDIVKLKAVEKGVTVLTSLVANLVTAVMFVFAFIFLSIGLALWIGTTMGNAYYGFLIVGSIYVLLGVLVMAAKKSLVENPMSSAIIKQVFKEDLS